MQQMTYTCDICKQRIPTGTLVLNGIAVSLPYIGKLHNPWLKVLNQDLDVCQACADKIESEFYKIQLNMISELNQLVNYSFDDWKKLEVGAEIKYKTFRFSRKPLYGKRLT